MILGPEDLEKAIYACLAQADLCIEAMDAKMSVQQLVASKKVEAEASENAAMETDAGQAAEAQTESTGTPTAQLHLVDQSAPPL